MSARTGTRRAAVLLALSGNPRSVYSLARTTGLKESAVSGIVDALSRTDLAVQHPRGWTLGTGPHVAEALAQARATVQASAQPDQSAVFSAASDGASLPGSLPASSRVTRGPDR
ncbi:hypothetical protein [Deinococcus radiodurans]|uniref:hypothetical protein n=1 Tax=Deinococcus radiodurans TaxID=1299 RepID=UPI000A81F14F|nr:hypothetical protein [Deinococcus radiodurans]QIP30415.1 hypothetical protein HAV23_14275 [Deinococcus radiodurans]QIP33226.1 hypothetical protein HAV35_13715 [Deinococcus radiodurans]UTA52207.1 hypothetical protein MSS93_16530 [Deinococcus radiodurans]